MSPMTPTLLPMHVTSWSCRFSVFCPNDGSSAVGYGTNIYMRACGRKSVLDSAKAYPQEVDALVGAWRLHGRSARVRKLACFVCPIHACM